MWLYLADANLSLSRHRDRPDCLMVRARDRASLESMFPAAQIEHTPEADYPWRAVLTAVAVADAVAASVRAIPYDDDVKNRADQGRRDLYRDLWAVTRGYQGGG